MIANTNRERRNRIVDPTLIEGNFVYSQENVTLQLTLFIWRIKSCLINRALTLHFSFAVYKNLCAHIHLSIKLPYSCLLEKTMKFRPLRDNVLIKRLEAKDKTAGGLILPDSAKDKPQEAEVIAVGPGRSNKDGSKVPMTVNIGDLVLFKKYSTTDVSLNGDDFLILKESDILAVVES